MSQPKRILLLDTGKEWGGGTNSMFELLKRIDRNRFEVTCCFYTNYRKGPEGQLLSDELSAIGIRLILLPMLRQPLWAKLAKELARAFFAWSKKLKKHAALSIDMLWRVKPQAMRLHELLIQGGYDLIYLNNQPSSNLEGYLAGENAQIPVVQHCRIEPAMQPREVVIVNRAVRFIICVSQGVARVLIQHQVAKSRLRVIYNAIDSEAVLPQPVVVNPPLGELSIGTVGQLTPRKGVSDLLNAVAVLKAEGIFLTCLILGDGPQRMELEALAVSLGIDDQTRFLGFQPNPLAWVQAMDICVLCSSKEGLPRVVLEAMIAGKPVVGSDVTGTQELVIHHETGFLYPYGDQTALVAALRQLVLNKALRQAMGMAAQRRVVEWFRIETYVDGVTAVFDEAMGP